MAPQDAHNSALEQPAAQLTQVVLDPCSRLTVAVRHRPSRGGHGTPLREDGQHPSVARIETVVPPGLEVEYHGLQRQLAVDDVAGNRHAAFRAHVRDTVEWLVDCGVQVPTNRCHSRILPPDRPEPGGARGQLEPFSYFSRRQGRQDDLNVAVVTT